MNQDQVLQNTQENLSRYFMAPPPTPDLTGDYKEIALGTVITLISATTALLLGNSCLTLVLVIIIALSILLIAKALYSTILKKGRHQQQLNSLRDQPTDHAVEKLFQARMQELVERSIQKLDPDLDPRHPDLTTVWGPLLRAGSGIPPTDIVCKHRIDGPPIFGIYKVVVMHLAKQYLGIYHCSYSFIRDAIVKEGSLELPYADILTVALDEILEADSDPLILPDGTRIAALQHFELVTRALTLRFPVDASHIKMTHNLESQEDFLVQKVRFLRHQIMNRRS